jgi:hypothetical protein
MESKRLIRISDNLSLNENLVTETIAILAKKGSGKTYAGTKLFEEMYALGAQVVALDPVGVWWGLRLLADGKGKGLDVAILGGDHGDVPLDPASGAFVARVIVEQNLRAVIDISNFRKNERKRFATEFAEELYHLKKSHRSAMHLFLEEAHTVVPQERQDGLDPRMLGAFEDIVRLGRNYGLGISLIDQRAASVNKNVLTQIEYLFAFKTVHPLDRATIEGWMGAKELKSISGVLTELRDLETGMYILCSPSVMGGTPVKSKVAAKKTFDASKTPEVGRAKVNAEPRPLTPEFFGKLSEAMKDVVERAKEEDPKANKILIKQLRTTLEAKELALKNLQAQLDREIAEPKVKFQDRLVPTPVITKEEHETIRRLTTTLDTALTETKDVADKLLATVSVAKAKFEKPLSEKIANLTLPARPLPQHLQPSPGLPDPGPGPASATNAAYVVDREGRGRAWPQAATHPRRPGGTTVRRLHPGATGSPVGHVPERHVHELSVGAKNGRTDRQPSRKDRHHG